MVTVGKSVSIIIDGTAGQVVGVVHDGATPTSINLQSYTPSAVFNDVVEIDWSGSAAEFFIGGVSKGTISTGLPTGSKTGRSIHYATFDNGGQSQLSLTEGYFSQN